MVPEIQVVLRVPSNLSAFKYNAGGTAVSGYQCFSACSSSIHCVDDGCMRAEGGVYEMPVGFWVGSVKRCTF